MAVSKENPSDGEPLKYNPKGDFGPYNEPSWVPEGKCKSCATIAEPLTGQHRRRTPDELRDLHVIGHTETKNLPVRTCEFCDAPAA